MSDIERKRREGLSKGDARPDSEASLQRELLREASEGADAADLVFNELYDDRKADGIRRFCGPAVACLREEFYSVRPRAAQDAVREILVTFGGTDPNNLTAGAPSVGRIDYDNHDPTTTDEVILGVEHEIVPGWAVGIAYTSRLRQNFIWNQFEKTRGSGNFYTPDDYVLGGTTDAIMPDGTAVSVPFYRLKPGVARPTFYATRNRPDYEQTYNGVELTAAGESLPRR